MQKNCLWILAALLVGGVSPVTGQQTGTVIQTETKLVLVDSVVTDKKGEYVRDLTMKDFKVWEDNKEQTIKSFSFEADPASAAANQKRYLVLFFDNSTIGYGDQAHARDAAARFIDANAGPNRMIAIVNFGGALQIAQNFTDDKERLKQVVSGVKTSAVAPNQRASAGTPAQLSQTMGGFGASDLVLSLRSLAKDLSSIPGRKIVVLLSGGTPLTAELTSEVTATLDVCNRSNVAIYAIDIRGLVGPEVSAPQGPPRASRDRPRPFGFLSVFAQALSPSPAIFGFQRGGIGGPGGGAPGGARGDPSGGTSPGAPAGGRGTSAGNTGNTGRPGSSTPTTTNSGRGGTPATTQTTPYNQSREIMPKFPPDITANQQLLFALANGTGGFVIHDTNDLLGGLQKIGAEQNEYYILGYTPPDSAEGSCHVLRVKVDRNGVNVRSRTGYCNAKSHDLLSGNPIEKDLENRISASQAGTIPASMQLPYFYTAPDIARVNVTLEISSEALKFEKVKGRFHSDINVLGIASTPDGAVGARFSDTLKLDLADKKQVDEFKERPLHYENQFDVAAGTYSLKVVFSSGGNSFGKVEMPLAVDKYDGNQFAISSLALSKQFQPVSSAGTGLDAELIEDRTPLIAGDVQIIPAGTSAFHKGEPAVFYMEVYEPLLANADPANPPAVAIRMRILDRKTGEAKEDTGAMRLDVPKAGGSPVVRTANRMPVDKLPPGDYTLEMTAQDTANQFAKRTADFELQ